MRHFGGIKTAFSLFVPVQLLKAMIAGQSDLISILIFDCADATLVDPKLGSERLRVSERLRPICLDLQYLVTRGSRSRSSKKTFLNAKPKINHGLPYKYIIILD